MLFFALALVYFFRLRTFGDPTGADGYFYLKQIRSLSEGAGFYYRDYSLAFLPPALLNVVVRDPALSYRIVTLAAFGATGWMVERLATRFAREAGEGSARGKRIFVAYALLFFAYGNLLLELNLVFLKTALGVLALLVAWDFASRGRRGGALGWGIAAMLAHKLMIPLVPLAALALGAGRIRFRGAGPRAARALGIAAAGALAVGTFAIRSRWVDHLRHLADRIDFGGFSPAAFETTPTAAAFSWLLAPGAILAFALARRLRARTEVGARFLAFAGALFALAFLAPTSLGPESARYRLLLVAVPFFPIVLGVAFLRGGAARVAAIALGAIPIAVGLRFDRPLATWVTPWSERIANEARLAEIVPPDALLYSPHGVEFYLAYRTPLRPRSLRVDPRGRAVYRVAYVAPYLVGPAGGESPLGADLERTALLRLGNEFALYREEDWNALNGIHLFVPHPMNLLPKKPDFVADYD